MHKVEQKETGIKLLRTPLITKSHSKEACFPSQASEMAQLVKSVHWSLISGTHRKVKERINSFDIYGCALVHIARARPPPQL